MDQEISGTFYIADFEAAPDFEEGVSITLADTVLNSNGTGGIYWRNQGEGQLTYGGTIDGKHIWQTNPEDGKHYMFLDVDDAYIYGHPQDCAVEVAVEYFDDTPSGNGPYLHYRNPSGAYVSSPINGSMGKGWRTARFLLTEGFSLGFSLLINDNDGTGRRGWIEFMSGIGVAKNPAFFGELLLID